MENKKESLFACDLTVLSAAEKQRVLELLAVLKQEMQEHAEYQDGYAFRYLSSTKLIQNVGEFISYERLCCPFFEFEFSVEPGGGPIWLRLSGAEGVKDFIRFEFGI